MKLSIIAIVSTLGLASAFAPSANIQQTTALHAEQSRKAFFSGAAAAAFGATFIPSIANAGSMAQENISDPTEQWETGSPTASAEKARMSRYTNARTQLTSNFPPQKRLTLERKSPVTRLDINGPGFAAYKKTYPGLYKTASK